MNQSDSNQSDSNPSDSSLSAAAEQHAGDGKTGMYIVIDKRERAIVPFFANGVMPHYVEHMTVGDIAICYNGHILIIIERKTWQDLASSMKDGRKANIEKLKALRDTTHCQIAYLLEGSAFPKPSHKFCGIPHKNLRAHLDHLAFRDNVHMLYAKTALDTAARVFELAKNYGTISPSMIDHLAPAADPEQPRGGNEPALRTKHTVSDELIISNMWTSIKNITHNNVSVFLNLYKLSDFLAGNTPKSEIATLKYPSGIMIGDARAAAILRSAKSVETHAKILSEIPSITRPTAAKILEAVAIADIIKSDPADMIQSIANIKKTEKARIGLASAKKVLKFISGYIE